MSFKIWLVLTMLTIFAFFIGYLKVTNILLISLLLISTFLKGQLITDYFMGLREVSIKYRVIPTFWLIVVLGLIAFFYYTSKGVS